MERQAAGTNSTFIRERQIWTQVRLAEEAGVSPTTVSGIEAGRISRPHFGTLRRLANALGVDPQALLSPEQSFSAEFSKQGRPVPLSLEWAGAAPLKRLQSLSQELEEEQRSPRISFLSCSIRASRPILTFAESLRKLETNRHTRGSTVVTQPPRGPAHGPSSASRGSPHSVRGLRPPREPHNPHEQRTPGGLLVVERESSRSLLARLWRRGRRG
jgi:transcriptional regulator with XRE-family HTH domain